MVPKNNTQDHMYTTISGATTVWCLISKEGNFGNSLQSHQSFIRQLLVTSEIAIEAGPEFAKVYFANSI